MESYEHAWVIGDDFVSDTTGEFFQSDNAASLYLRQNYDVKICFSTSLSLNKSTTARLHNNLVNAIEENPLLPKAIVMMVDADIIKTVD